MLITIMRGDVICSKVLIVVAVCLFLGYYHVVYIYSSVTDLVSVNMTTKQFQLPASLTSENPSFNKE